MEFAVDHMIDLAVDLGAVMELHLGFDLMVGLVVNLMVDQAFDLGVGWKFEPVRDSSVALVVGLVVELVHCVGCALMVQRVAVDAGIVGFDLVDGFEDR